MNPIMDYSKIPRLEARRKAFHGLLGIGIAIALHFLGNRLVLYGAVIGFVISVIFRERVLKSKKVPIIQKHRNLNIFILHG